MTPKTLRKERREKLDNLFIQEGIYPTSKDDRERLIEKVLEAVESRSEIRGIEAAMFADRPVTPEDIGDPDEALKAFETAMHLPGNWQWYPAKSSDETAWKGLREFVGKLYRAEGAKGFEDYFTWSIQPYSRGAMSIPAIKRNPADFESSWAAFKAHVGMHKTDENRGIYKTDENGVPETY